MEENTMKKDLVQEVQKAKKAEGGDTVTVGCGFPMGVKFNLSSGVLELKGVELTHLVSATKIRTPLPAGKYGYTTIKKSQWEEILKNYGNCDFILKGTIFAEKTTEAVCNKGNALMAEGKRTGFEQAKKQVKKKKAEDEE